MGDSAATARRIPLLKRPLQHRRRTTSRLGTHAGTWRNTLATMDRGRSGVTTNPAHYRTIFENEFVRVLEYNDGRGESTTPASEQRDGQGSATSIGG